MKNRKGIFLTVFLIAGLMLSGCDDLLGSSSSSSYDYNYGSITVTPASVTLVRGDTQQFSASESWGVTWSLEGATGNSNINTSGLLTVGSDETASTLTVKASKSSYTTGTAQVTVASPSSVPSGLTVTKPGPSSVALSWAALSGASEYTVQRSANGKDFGQIGRASGASYIDNAVSAGASYYYRIQANGVNSPMVFTFVEDYFNMPTFAQKKLIPLNPSSKHYYRFAVISGNEYTIEWQNGNNQNAHTSVRATAYQNNGTAIFSDAAYGYTDPRVFTATSTGFVTVVVSNISTNTSYDYQVYCYGANGSADAGTVALPPYQVTAFRVSVPSSNSITLTWDSVSDAARYNIYRANTQNGTPGKIGESYSTEYTDGQVPSGGSFWYTIAAVNADGREGCRLQGAFGIAAAHYALSIYSSTQTFSLSASGKHYYRLAVTQGTSYTIQWQNGNNQNAHTSVRATAYQNNGTAIFSEAAYGYTDPKVFTATSTGFVTVVVSNISTNTSYDYQIYYY